jgi:DNA polymerase-3 subunit gamma/tau
LSLRKVSDGLNAIHRALDSGTDPRQFARQLVDYLRAMMLTRLGNADQLEITAEMKKQLFDLSQAFSLPALINAINLFNRAAYLSQASWQPALQLELALTEALEDPPLVEKKGVESSIRPQQAVSRPSFTQAQSTPNSQAQSSRVVSPSQNKGNVQAQTKPPAMPSQVSTGVNNVSVSGSIENKDLKKILEQWLNIKAAVKPVSAETAALLTSTKLVSMHNQMLLLGFASELLKTKMESNSHIDLTRQKIKEVSGVDIPIICTVVNINDKTITNDMQLDRDGIVGTALAMGGKIVEDDAARDKKSPDLPRKE